MISKDELTKLLPSALGETNLPLPNKQTGKVREWYDLPDGKRLIITTDRLSAFDRILAKVPYKGQVLNQLSAWWFEQTQDIIPNHLLSVPDPNASIVTTVQPLPVEVIVRGYISGVTTTALWYRYSIGERKIYGYDFPEGLKKNQALPEPIITPTTKGGETGHDERLTCAEVTERGLLNEKTWNQVQQAALAIFKRGQEVANKAGLILVDTKYEFGITPDGEVILIDEVHTPDSSRYWKADTYEKRFNAGEEPENFDKEFVRIAYAEKGYRGDGDTPSMPDELWAAASERYITIYEMLTGKTFDAGEYPIESRLANNLRSLMSELAPIRNFLPKDKTDFENTRKIISLGYPTVEPVLKELFTWVQDINFPIAKEMAGFLSSIGKPIVPYVQEILNTNDDIWKYFTLAHVVNHSSEDVILGIQKSLERIANNPTENEKREDVQEIAKALLAKFD